MYIYVHICTYMYIHICTYMYIYVHICPYMHIFVHTCTYMYLYVYHCDYFELYAALWRSIAGRFTYIFTYMYIICTTCYCCVLQQILYNIPPRDARKNVSGHRDKNSSFHIPCTKSAKDSMQILYTSSTSIAM